MQPNKPTIQRQHQRKPEAGLADARDKDQPLVRDIRLLGRLLGDVIREHEGVEAFELVERVRQLSVAFRLKKDASAGRVLNRPRIATMFADGNTMRHRVICRRARWH